jgi:hypothetical protein
VTRPGKASREQGVADLFAADPEAAVLRVLQQADSALSAVEIKKALQAYGMAKADADRLWPEVQKRIKTHENVILEGLRYSWSSGEKTEPSAPAGADSRAKARAVSLAPLWVEPVPLDEALDDRAPAGPVAAKRSATAVGFQAGPPNPDDADFEDGDFDEDEDADLADDEEEDEDDDGSDLDDDDFDDDDEFADDDPALTGAGEESDRGGSRSGEGTGSASGARAAKGKAARGNAASEKGAAGAGLAKAWPAGAGLPSAGLRSAGPAGGGLATVGPATVGPATVGPAAVGPVEGAEGKTAGKAGDASPLEALDLLVEGRLPDPRKNALVEAIREALGAATAAASAITLATESATASAAAAEKAVAEKAAAEKAAAEKAALDRAAAEKAGGKAPAGEAAVGTAAGKTAAGETAGKTAGEGSAEGDGGGAGQGGGAGDGAGGAASASDLAADLEELARQRQAVIDSVRLLAELASEIEELIVNETEPEVMIRQVRAWVKRSGLDPVGQAGEEVRYNRAMHRPIGAPIRDGAMVVVVRPGYIWKAADKDVLLGKAVVEE